MSLQDRQFQTTRMVRPARSAPNDDNPSIRHAEGVATAVVDADGNPLVGTVEGLLTAVLSESRLQTRLLQEILIQLNGYDGGEMGLSLVV